MLLHRPLPGLHLQKRSLRKAKKKKKKRRRKKRERNLNASRMVKRKKIKRKRRRQLPCKCTLHMLHDSSCTDLAYMALLSTSISRRPLITAPHTVHTTNLRWLSLDSTLSRISRSRNSTMASRATCSNLSKISTRPSCRRVSNKRSLVWTLGPLRRNSTLPSSKCNRSRCTLPTTSTLAPSTLNSSSSTKCSKPRCPILRPVR